jgi:hypothetical protein
MIEPVSTGMPMSQPIWAVSQRKRPFSTRKVTRTPLRVQTAKQRVKARVLMARAVVARDRSDMGGSAVEKKQIKIS